MSIENLNSDALTAFPNIDDDIIKVRSVRFPVTEPACREDLPSFLVRRSLNDSVQIVGCRVNRRNRLIKSSVPRLRLDVTERESVARSEFALLSRVTGVPGASAEREGARRESRAI